MKATFSAELVAPAIAGLTETQLRNLVDQGTFGTWLAKQTTTSSDSPQAAPDSQEASELAMNSADSEYEATQLLATLTEEQREEAASQAAMEIGRDAKDEILMLM